MQTKTVLLGWELGAGIGYCLQLKSLAEGLQEYGYKPVLALRSIDSVHKIFRQCDFPVLQAPYVTGRLTDAARTEGFFSTGFTDLMACNGFGSEDHLYSMLRGWRELIDLVQPDLVVARFSPLLTTAASGRIPSVVFGSPYATPPADGAWFPQLCRDEPPYADQSRLLEIVCNVQRMFRAPEPEHLTDVYRGDRRCIVSIPELDPYDRDRSEPCEGLFDNIDEPVDNADTRYFAYLAGDGPLQEMALTALQQTGMPGSVYVRDGNIAPEYRHSCDVMQFCQNAPDLQLAVSNAAVVVHHGGLGTTQTALALGRPQVILPQVYDQRLTADLLEEMPFIRGLQGAFTRDDIADCVVALAEDDEVRHTAMQFAASIHSRQLLGAREKIVQHCLDLLSDS